MNAAAKMTALLAVLCLTVSFLASSPVPQARTRVVIASTARVGWTNATKPLAPPGVAGGMMAYDSKADRFVSFGGSDGDPTNGTWVLDPTTMNWTQMQPSVSPPARVDGALTYDDRADAFVLFGGWREPADEVYTRLGDTWVYYLANDTWVPQTTAHAPEARSDAAIAYDPRDDVLLLFGGFNGSAYLGDAWQYLFASHDWTPVRGSSAPSGRADGRMAYDPTTNAFYVFGGNDYSGPNFTFHHLDDTWRFNPVSMAWAQVFPQHPPGARDYTVFAADDSAGEMLSLGGFGDSVVLGELWAFNATAMDWRNLTAPGGPSPRMAAVGGYSPAERVFVVFGGGDKTSTKNDTWMYRFPGPLTGSISLSSTTPDIGVSVRFTGHVYGGSGVFRDLKWEFGDGSTSTGAESSHAFASTGTYAVHFQAADDMGDVVNVTTQVTVGSGSLPYLLGAVVLGSVGVLAAVAFRKSRRKAPPARPL